MRSFIAISCLLGLTASASAQAPEGSIVVVVESSRASIEPRALREALARALEASVVVLGEADGRPRAVVSVAVRADGDATAHVQTREGGELSGSVALGETGAGEADRLGAEIATLVRTAEGRVASSVAVRAGLVPWEADGLRPYPPALGTASGALVPWPASAPIGRWGSEHGDGLATPPPRAPVPPPPAQKR